MDEPRTVDVRATRRVQAPRDVAVQSLQTAMAIYDTPGLLGDIEPMEKLMLNLGIADTCSRVWMAEELQRQRSDSQRHADRMLEGLRTVAERQSLRPFVVHPPIHRRFLRWIKGGVW